MSDLPILDTINAVVPFWVWWMLFFLGTLRVMWERSRSKYKTRYYQARGLKSTYNRYRRRRR